MAAPLQAAAQPMAINSGALLNQANQGFSPEALGSLGTFLQTPDQAQLALMPQFNPSGGNQDFFQQLAATMAPVKSQVADSLAIMQSYQNRTALVAQQQALLGGLPAAGLGTPPAVGGIPGVAQPTGANNVAAFQTLLGQLSMYMQALMQQMGLPQGALPATLQQPVVAAPAVAAPAVSLPAIR